MDIRERFKASYGVEAEVAAAAPGRLEVLGNHTDYNEGFVLSCAVGQRTVFALRRVSGRSCRVRDFRDCSETSFDLDRIDRPAPRDWGNYIRGVIVGLRRRGHEIPAFDGAVMSDVPLSAGMSSSAALETAVGFAFARAFGIELAPAEWARVGQGVENDYLGLKTGLLDQFSSIFGRRDALILSDFRTVEVLKTVPLPPGYRLVVVNSMVKHNLVDSEYNSRRADCEACAAALQRRFPGMKTLRDASMEDLEAVKDGISRREFLRASHVIGECRRVREGVRCLESGDIGAFGRLLFESHESSRTAFENSVPELDYLVELAHSVPGCLGARLSGGGFGGITIHLVRAEAAEEYAARVAEAFAVKFSVRPGIILCDIGDGARILFP